jgi:DUF1680 family protein
VSASFRSVPFAVLLAGVPLWAAAPQEPVVVNAVTDLYRPFPFDQEKLGGIIGARIRANSEGYIERVLASAANRPITPQTGIFVDAGVYAFEYNHDPHLGTVVQTWVKKLIAAQSPTGYIGNAASEAGWTAEDTWAQAAALSGLVNYYRVTGDQNALSAATKLGNLFVVERKKGRDSAVFVGAVTPMVGLYRFTDDRKYLEFCTAAAEAWLRERPPESSANYRSLAILNGLVELYRVSGENAFFKAPLQSWTTLHASGFTLTGVPATTAPGGPVALDACTTDGWLELTANLLQITGQPVYTELLERTVYNQLFAGQDARTGAVLAPVGWTAKKEPANDNACAAYEVRALARVPALVWGRYGNGIAVNLYTDARGTVRLRRRGTIQLYAETNYPTNGTVLLHVEPDHAIHFPLRLRVPEWTTNFTADIAQDHLVGKPGDFLILNRNWKRGDTVRINMPLPVRAIVGIGEFSQDVALARGPQVLALGKTLNAEIKNFDDVTVDPQDASDIQIAALDTNFAATWMGDQAYSVSGTYQGQRRKLILLPFADAVNYRVWLAQSKASSGASGR